MPILYSLVSRGTCVLAEFTTTSGNFTTVTRSILAGESSSARSGLALAMFALPSKHKDKDILSNSRLVEVSKLANSRVGVGLTMRGRDVTIAQVAASSPLEGHVFPGDVINLSGNGSARLLDGLTSTRAPDANVLAAAFHAASQLSIQVETPTLLTSAYSVFILASNGGDLGIEVDKDHETGRARVNYLAPGSAAATKVGRDVLAPGDLIVAVSEGGTLYDVATAKEAAAKLKHSAAGAIELRVVRPPDEPSQTPRSAHRPSSARSIRHAELVPPQSALCSLPPAYTTAIALAPGDRRY